ncbi:hypothetical protein [Mesorhizobium sp. WSM1293]|nr:hypothetical protein [Mesorhizobium sp. WSM1293]
MEIIAFGGQAVPDPNCAPPPGISLLYVFSANAESRHHNEIP